METTQAAQRRVRYQFEIFCMKIIDGERCDYLRQLMKKMEWESSFSDLPEAVLTNLCTFDSDPAEQYMPSLRSSPMLACASASACSCAWRMSP